MPRAGPRVRRAALGGLSASCSPAGAGAERLGEGAGSPAPRSPSPPGRWSCSGCNARFGLRNKGDKLRLVLSGPVGKWPWKLPGLRLLRRGAESPRRGPCTRLPCQSRRGPGRRPGIGGGGGGLFPEILRCSVLPSVGSRPQQPS